MMEVFHEMRRYEKLAEEHLNFGTLSVTTLVDKRNLVQYRLLALPPSEEMAYMFRKSHPNYEPCRVAMLIYGMGVVFPISKAAPMSQLVGDLYVALEQSGLKASTWTNCNWLLLWILMVGAIAAECSRERRWFIVQLGQVAARKSLSSYDEVREQLARILWLPEACETAGRGIWQEVEGLSGY
jgi:hypothetical protein